MLLYPVVALFSSLLFARSALATADAVAPVALVTAMNDATANIIFCNNSVAALTTFSTQAEVASVANVRSFNFNLGYVTN